MRWRSHWGEMTVEALTKSYEVNLRGPVFLVQEALPHLKASSHAAVLNMVSVGAFIFSPMTVHLFVDEGGDDVVHPVDGRRVRVGRHPGQRDRARTGRHLHDAQNPQEAIDAHGRRHADETAGDARTKWSVPALLLCSDAGSYMTGTVIIADGGGTPR